MTTTWNPADASAGKFTFSNGNLTATSDGSFHAWNMARANTFKSTGKWYFEFHANAYDAGFSLMIGLANATASLTNFSGADNNGIGFQSGGSLYQNSVQLINGDGTNGYSVGTDTAIAVDLDNHLIWVWDQQQSRWNNSVTANPGAGTGGISFVSLGACTPAISVDNGGAANAGTLNTGASAFTYDPPFGFFAWDGSATGNVQTMLQVWARALHKDPVSGLWAPGNWSNRFSSFFLSGGPEENIGGVSFQGATIKPGPFGGSAVPLYLTAFGTGDAGITLVDYPTGFVATPPRGFGWGWPNPLGAPGDKFDPATIQGSATLADGGLNPYKVNMGASPGLIQSETGVTLGSYYYEYFVEYDIFSQKAGIGIGRRGVDMSAWSTGGGFSIGDDNGGAYIDGGNLVSNYQPFIQANKGAQTLVPPPLVPSGQGMGVAVTIGPFNATFQPQPLMPTPLVCIPCVELVLPNQTFRNRFGS